MAPKGPVDNNLAFLYLCLKNVENPTINFNAVAKAAGLNPPAARMRFTRMKKAIEGFSGSENDANDTVIAAQPAPTEKGKKRAKGTSRSNNKARTPKGRKAAAELGKCDEALPNGRTASDRSPTPMSVSESVDESGSADGDNPDEDGDGNDGDTSSKKRRTG